MDYNEERLVTIASIQTTPEKSAKFSAHARLLNSKVAVIANALIDVYIDEEIDLPTQKFPTNETLRDVIRKYKESSEKDNN